MRKGGRNSSTSSSSARTTKDVLVGTGVADGVFDQSSPKFEAKILAVRHAVESVFSRMLELVVLASLVCRIFFSVFFVWSLVVASHTSTSSGESLRH